LGGRSSRGKASSSSARTTRASAAWRSASIPTATRSFCTGDTSPMGRQEALERYRALPLPDTSMEAWRFTDLAGFDPDSFAQNGHVPGTVTRSGPERPMLDVDVSGLALVGEGGVEIERIPEGIRFEPLSESEDLLGSLVGADDKFTAHNAAAWKH